MLDPNQTMEKMITQPAEAGGYGGRSVRLAGGKVPVCTATYNYCQDHETRAEVARRIAALWTLAQGIPTSALEAAIAEGRKLTTRPGTPKEGA